MVIVRGLGLAALALIVSSPVDAQGLPTARSPQEAGFSAAGLKRLSDRIDAGVGAGELPGAVVLIARNGKIVFFDAYGYRDRATHAPMKTDAIFRIASMTKPIVAVAAMMLVEQRKLALGDPVSKYIPAFAGTPVAVKRENDDGTEEMGSEPQRRPMTVRNLLLHTSGLTYAAVSGNQVKQSYIDMKVMVPDQTNAEMVEKLAKLALLYQPGSHWEYSISMDVLGRVIEVASGKALDAFIAERITGPLKMVDTAFEAPPGQKDRAARPQKEGPRKALPLIPDVTLETTWKSGGAGLVSTAADYARFLQMLANGGELDGVRLLSEKTVDLMTSNQLPSDIEMGDGMDKLGAMEPSASMGQGFGLGFAVRTEQGRNPLPGSVGDYGWSGGYGTFFWSDPHKHMFVIFMMQSQSARQQYRALMRDGVYGALTGN